VGEEEEGGKGEKVVGNDNTNVVRTE